MIPKLVCIGTIAAAIAAAASPPNNPTTQIVITATFSHHAAPELRRGDVTVVEGKNTVPVVNLQRFAGDLAGMQLFVFLDDSTRAASLGTHLPELRTFLTSLPATTQVAVRYMNHGTFTLAQRFTTDHQKAAEVLRLPQAIPGENGSPYFGLSDLVKHWPSKEPTARRAVLALTDGVDRYYDAHTVEDPYVRAAIHDAVQNGVAISSIYLRGAGIYGLGGWSTTVAQSRLGQVSEETGGHAYFQDLGDPVQIATYLSDFHDRLNNQYLLTFEARGGLGMQPVKVQTELPGVKIDGPSRILVR
jgi:hypothetical protein